MDCACEEVLRSRARTTGRVKSMRQALTGLDVQTVQTGRKTGR